jgi:hypothetical protein
MRRRAAVRGSRCGLGRCGGRAVSALGGSPPPDWPSVLSQDWRERHCEAGDAALSLVWEIVEMSKRDDRGTQVLVLGQQAAVMAAIAQAHYAAANVRAWSS